MVALARHCSGFRLGLANMFPCARVRPIADTYELDWMVRRAANSHNLVLEMVDSHPDPAVPWHVFVPWAAELGTCRIEPCVILQRIKVDHIYQGTCELGLSTKHDTDLVANHCVL